MCSLSVSAALIMGFRLDNASHSPHRPQWLSAAACFWGPSFREPRSWAQQASATLAGQTSPGNLPALNGSVTHTKRQGANFLYSWQEGNEAIPGVSSGRERLSQRTQKKLTLPIVYKKINHTL